MSANQMFKMHRRLQRQKQNVAAVYLKRQKTAVKQISLPSTNWKMGMGEGLVRQKEKKCSPYTTRDVD